MIRKLTGIGVMMALWGGSASADAATDILNPGFLQKPVQQAAEAVGGVVRQRVENELWYIIILSLLMVATLVVVLQYMKQQADHGAKDVVNAAGLVLVIFGTIMLVMVVQTSEQLTAAIGLLGAVAGYLFRSVQETGGKAARPPQPGELRD
jgi:uncharacterized BrkB/YihY/UPF0761 family membrane protein